MKRIHLLLSEELLERVDERVGARERSRFISEAVRERLDRIQLEEAARRASGVASGRGHQHWRDRERTAEWVRSARREA